MSALVVDTSIDAARRALGVMWAHVPAEELVELSARRKGKWTSVFGSAEEMLAVGGGAEAAHKASVAGADVYVGAVSLAERPAAGRRGGAGLRRTASALWIDLDALAPGRTGSKYFASPEEAAGDLDRIVDDLFGAGASERVMVLHSGWGCQGWFPLDVGMEARVASRLVRRLVEAIQAGTGGKHVDRLFDVSRVMRAPSTFNWRGGVDLEAATGVVRWANGGAWAEAELDAGLPAGSAAAAVSIGGRLGGPGGGPLLDVETTADRVLSWAEVLVPEGWTLSGGGGREKEVWGRPGRAGERSAVVFADEPNLLVVFSSAAECGFGTGLRGAGARGDGAGVGVISKWRALVDLKHKGDRAAAIEDEWSDGGLLGSALAPEVEFVGRWVNSSWNAGLGDVYTKEERHKQAAEAVSAADGGGAGAGRDE